MRSLLGWIPTCAEMTEGFICTDWSKVILSSTKTNFDIYPGSRSGAKGRNLLRSTVAGLKSGLAMTSTSARWAGDETWEGLFFGVIYRYEGKKSISSKGARDSGWRANN